MKKLQTILLGCLLVGFLMPAPSVYSAVISSAETAIFEAPPCFLPVRMARTILAEALPHINAEMGESFTMREALTGYYRYGTVSINRTGTDPATGQGMYQIVYLDCSVLVLVDEF